MIEVTQYSAVNIVLDVLLKRIQDIIGDRLVGVYLYGSFVAGDFDEKISDIDLDADTVI